MSAIQKELVAAGNVTAKRGETRQAFLLALIVAIGKLSDANWAKLSADAQNWFNDAADEQNAAAEEKRAAVLPDFPDVEEEKPATSRRRAVEPKEEPKPEPEATDAPEVGDEVSVTTRRGKVATGKVIEMDDTVIVVDNGTEEVEITMDGAVIEVLGAEAEEDQGGEDEGGSDEGAGDEPTAFEPSVGDEVVVTNSRDKTTTGKIVEVTDDLLVVDDGKDEVEFVRSRVKSIVPVPLKPADEPKATTRRRAAAAEEPATTKTADKKETKTEKAATGRAKSVGARIREIIADDLAISEADVSKILTKEGVDFRPPTLNMIYKDTMSFVAMLEGVKKLKK